MWPYIELLSIKVPQFHPLIEHVLSKRLPDLRAIFQCEYFNGTCAESVASLGCHDYVTTSHDSHLERHPHGTRFTILIGLENSIPPSLLNHSKVWLRVVIAAWKKLYKKTSVSRDYRFCKKRTECLQVSQVPYLVPEYSGSLGGNGVRQAATS